MIKRIFFILEGNNGATYIFNVKDIDAISESLKFYKARTVKQKVMKNALKLYLNVISLLCGIFGLCAICAIKDKNEIEEYLKKLTDLPMDFELDENCSILISPTRDKIIVHHHEEYFHKFAFGNSYSNVKSEVDIYKLFNKSLHHFEVSEFYDYVNMENELCRFKLSNKLNSENSTTDLVSVLVEMFQLSTQNKQSFSVYLNELRNRYEKSNIVCNEIVNMLDILDSTQANKQISFGLVHRDFKPWNINDEQGLLIYDFEEAVVDGPPLEDLFNYYIDPIVRYVSSSEVIEEIFSPVHVNEYKRYLNELSIDIDFETLLYCHFIEKILFYNQSQNNEIRNKYIDVLMKLDEIKHKGYK